MSLNGDRNASIYLLIQEILHQYMLELFLIVDLIIRIKTRKRKWKDANKSANALLIARGVVNAKFECAFGWEDVYNRLAQLENRYNTFKQIVNNPHTYWDQGLNRVITNDNQWKSIIKNNSFAQAYYHRGEPEFNRLCMIFGRDDTKVEMDHTVILISDATFPIGEPNNATIVISDDEEVTSPMPKENAQIRRNSFYAEHSLVDVESSNNRGPYYIEDGPDGAKKFPLVNAFPPRPKETRADSKGTGTSSCASSSPTKWWYNPLI